MMFLLFSFRPKTKKISTNSGTVYEAVKEIHVSVIRIMIFYTRREACFVSTEVLSDSSFALSYTESSRNASVPLRFNYTEAVDILRFRSLPNQALSHQVFTNLNGIGGSSFSEVIGYHPHIKCFWLGFIPSEPADKYLVTTF